MSPYLVPSPPHPGVWGSESTDCILSPPPAARRDRSPLLGAVLEGSTSVSASSASLSRWRKL